MSTTVVNTETKVKAWGGGNQPLQASYGKMMMWFFIVSDALTFSGFLAAYGFSRFKFIDSWPIADEVFTHFPFLHGVDAPMYYVAFMTFVLIMSSVTMVLAVDGALDGRPSLPGLVVSHAGDHCDAPRFDDRISNRGIP